MAQEALDAGGSYWFDFDALSEADDAANLVTGASLHCDTLSPGLLTAPNAPCVEGQMVQEDEPVLCSDANGMPRGRCEGCGRCTSWTASNTAFVCWTPGAANRTSSGCRMEEGTRAGKPMLCDACGCPDRKHQDLGPWRTNVRQAMRRFRATGRSTNRLPPRQSRLPASATTWDAADVALYALTGGLCDHRLHSCQSLRHVHDSSPKEIRKAAALVSVITPTSEGRQAFHPLLYKCFCMQTYEPKELVVIDTGDRASPFLQEAARRDPRVVYRWFPVQDSREDDLADAVWLPQEEEEPGLAGLLARAMRRRPACTARGAAALESAPRAVRGGAQRKGWSLGMKRNIACRLARGEVIAHFDDDDLYAPAYLEVMCARLMEAAKPAPVAPTGAPLLPAAATLATWHVLDLCDLTFGFVSPKTEALLPHALREAYAYGFGFSYVYTKAAWHLEAFADREWAEDGQFTGKLIEMGKPVRLVYAGVMAAHSHHPHTTSGGECVDVVCEGSEGGRVAQSVRLGSAVDAPKEFDVLMPELKEAVRALGLSAGGGAGEVHPIRREAGRVRKVAVGEEVGLRGKQRFLNGLLGKDIAHPEFSLAAAA